MSIRVHAKLGEMSNWGFFGMELGVINYFWCDWMKKGRRPNGIGKDVGEIAIGVFADLGKLPNWPWMVKLKV